MKNKAKLFGFTLIELLFVVAISSILVAVGLSMAQQYSAEIKVKRAALQMNQLLQAGMEYYADNGCWPGGGSCAVPTPPNFTNYIPISYGATPNPTNPWGNAYLWTILSNGNFEVRTDAPSASIANRVAGILPSGTVGAAGKSCTTSNCVLAEATIARLPPKVQQNIILVALGEFNGLISDPATTVSLPAFSCPVGSQSVAAIISTKAITYSTVDAVDDSTSSPDMPLLISYSLTDCPKDGSGFVKNPCTMWVTFNNAGVKFKVRAAVNAGETYRDIYVAPSSPDIVSGLTYQYEIYCCTSTTCTP
jgi:prepilin-type N-terminal cleavage/methylation domain-containing protein